MTYRRKPGSWAAAVSRILEVCGPGRAALAAGVSASRLRQLANPTRRDCAVLDVALALDLIAARDGLGTPVFETYRARLIEAGALRPGAAMADLALLRRAVRAGCLALLKLLPDAEAEEVAA